MNFGFLIFSITALFIANTYYDGQLFKNLLKYKKYYQIALFAFMGFSFYLFVKKNPSNGKQMLNHANSFVKYMPIDKNSSQILTPIISLTNKTINQEYDSPIPMQNNQYNAAPLQNKTVKRSVSETKKKYVASLQNWHCANCKNQLSAWFEVDHKIRLADGGTNDTNNLVALCRECHGEKTAMENL